MKTIRFNAPEQDTLILKDGRSISGGGFGEVENDEAEELATAPWTDVDIMTDGQVALALKDEEKNKSKALENHTRFELNTIAEEEGVHSPQVLANKDEVINAIEDSRKGVYEDPTQAEPEADSEGPEIDVVDEDDDDEDEEE